MAKKTTAATSQAIPGQFFRYPNIGARSKFISDSNNEDVATTLNTGTQISAATTKLDNLDIVKTLLFVINLAVEWTNTGTTLKLSPFFPFNAVQQLSIQFESAFMTYRLPGALAAVMQQARPALSDPKGLMKLTNMTTNVQQTNEPTSHWSQASELTPTGLTLDTGTSQTIPLLFEVPVAMTFDLYWELDELGNAKGAPIPRAIVSPQYMAANTRTVTPKILYAPGISVEDLLGGAVAKGSTDVTSTFTGTAAAQIFRDGWYPASQEASPPVYGWQYSRDYLEQPTSGQSKVNVPLDQDVTGQGQILMVVGFVWDPAGASGFGAVTPLDDYAEIDLNFSSKLPIYQDTPQTMQYRWLGKHGILLPDGFWGYDLALTEDGRFTNEEAMNTLITAGCQVQLQFNSGSAPSATSTVYTGIEILKAVTS
jgi:hypothetical protein